MFKSAIRFVLFVLILLAGATSAFALESSLAGIDVNQDNQGKYNIKLKLDKSVNINKYVDNTNNMTLVLSSVLPSESLEIIYDNAADLNNVIVQKKNDNTIILLQGDNIENANIYTQELSSGVIKPADINKNSETLSILNNRFISFSVLGVILLFILMINSKPKEKHYAKNNTYETVKSKNYANTLRHKNLIQSKKIPSINYKINGKFNNSNTTTIPKDFVINNYNTIESEKIRKAG